MIFFFERNRKLGGLYSVCRFFEFNIRMMNDQFLTNLMYVSDVKNVIPLLRGSYMRADQLKEAATSTLLNLANITVRFSGISTVLVASLNA